MADQHPYTGKVPYYDILNTRNNSSIYNESLGRTATRSVQARNSFFYASAFKQLHSLQQKQVGLIVGAAVADAALQPLQEVSSLEALSHLICEADEAETMMNSAIGGNSSSTTTYEDSSMRPNLRLIKDEMAPVSDNGIMDACIFATPASIRRANTHTPIAPPPPTPLVAVEEEEATVEEGSRRSNLTTMAAVGEDTSNPPANTKKLRKPRAPPTSPQYLDTLSQGHTYPYSLSFQYIQRYTSERHAPSLAKVAALWSQAAQAQSHEYAPFHGQLPIVTACCALLAAPATYAWADKPRLYDYTDPFVDCLLEELSSSSLPASATEETSSIASPKEEETSLSREETLRIAKGATQAFLLLTQKSLQHNPSPVVNTLHCVSDPIVRQLMFANKALDDAGDCRNEAIMAQLKNSRLYTDGLILRMATDIVHRAPTYKDGILMCTRRSCSSSLSTAAAAPLLHLKALPALGMLVGACLGAKFGVQHIPTEWVMATPDHSTACTSAMDVANWSWNTPSRLKQGTI